MPDKNYCFAFGTLNFQFNQNTAVLILHIYNIVLLSSHTHTITVPSSPTTPDGSKVPVPRQPTNLLGTFLTFSSIVLQNVKGIYIQKDEIY